MAEIPQALSSLDPKVLEELQLILHQAEEGNQEFLPALRVALDRHPEIWQEFGDLARHALESRQQLIAGENLLLRESLGRKVEALRQELSGPDPSHLELLLIERIVACWLDTQHADALLAQTKSATAAQHTALQRRLTSSQHRHLKAIQALATHRKLIKPALSPLDLATRSVAETTGRPVELRQRAGFSAGEPVVN